VTKQDDCNISVVILKKIICIVVKQTDVISLACPAQPSLLGDGC